MKLQRSIGGAVAGSLAAALWAAQQPLDKRVFECEYDDVELLGKLVTGGREWPLVGLAIHMGNGAAFGAVYSQLRPFAPAPPVARGGRWGPSTRRSVRAPPARRWPRGCWRR